MKSTNPEISVIIPVYNCEKYLETCLDSLKAQSYKNFEVLIVNNGSVDNSYNIAKSFEDIDERFKVIEHHGGMAGEARNIGVTLAKGKYISFVDADDTVCERYLEELHRAIVQHDADISICGFRLFYRKSDKVKGTHRVPHGKVYNKTEALRELLRDRKMRFYLWNKLWKKSLFTENNIKIPNMYYEDAVVCSQLFSYAEKVVMTDYCGYSYVRASSRKYIELEMNAKRINNYINTIPMIRRHLEQIDIYDQVKKPFSRHIFHVFFSIPGLCIQARDVLEDGILKNSFSGMKKVITCCSAPQNKLEELPDITAIK